MDIYLTLDYELFMGPSTGSVHKCLIEPVHRLLSETSDLGIRYTFFVDVAYLYRLNQIKGKSESLNRDYEQVTNNLREIISLGHEIQLHIHPQWFFSDWINGGWVLDYEHYKLSDLKEEECYRLCSESRILLESIIGKRVVAFRAGGYSLQTLTDHVGFLKSNGILIDSSVASRQCKLSKYQYYDYSNIGGEVYRFSQSILMPDPSGEILELPISSISINITDYYLYRLFVKICNMSGDSYGDGRPVNSSVSKKRYRLFNPCKRIVLNVSMDYITAPLLRRAYKNAKNSAQKELVIIGHPKNLSNKSIMLLRSFIERVQNESVFKLVSELQQ